MKYFNKKSVALIFVILIIFLVAPKPTFAVGPSFETNPLVWLYNIITSSESTITSGATVATKVQQALEWAFKLATEILKRQLLDKVVDKTVDWIQGGGDPQFITDWPGFLREAVDQAGGKFIQELGLGRFCSYEAGKSFGGILKVGLIPIPTFEERTSCTLTRAGENLEDFLGDFKKGGWANWQIMVLEPQNNIYGAYVMAWDQYEIEKAAALITKKSEVEAGKGFLGVKKCLDWDTAAINNCLDTPGADLQKCKNAGCTKWETITPGSLIGDQVAKAVGSDFDFIVNAEDLKAYAAAIANAIFNRITKEGVGLLHMGATPSSVGVTEVTEGPLPPSTVQIQTQCAQFLGTEAYRDCLTEMQNGTTDIREFEKNYMLSSIDGYLDSQTQLLEIKRGDLFLLNESSKILGQLLNCQPSNDLTGRRDTRDALDRVTEAATTTNQIITQTQSNIIAVQTKKQEIEAITDISQMPSPWVEFVKAVWPEFTEVVKPAIIQNLDLSAVLQDTNTRQEDLTTWYKRLTSCQLLHP